MPPILNLLILEDNKVEAELMVRRLETEGYTVKWQRAENEEEFIGLMRGEWDVILADYTLPGYDAMRALKAVQAANLDIPFIVVTGTIGDEAAAAIVKQGATDYILKDRPARLGQAIEMALEEKRLRLEQSRSANDRQIIESQLHQAQKMEAIGRLAGGIAHDFNNLLTIIQGNANVALLKLPADSPAREDIEQIEQAAERASGLTSQLLTFSRKQPLERKAVDMNKVIADIQKMIMRVIGEDVELEITAGDDLWPVLIDPRLMDQALLNLVVNSRDAMPEGGRITIATKNLATTEEFIRTRPELRLGDYVVISVTDTGIGMTPDVMERVFEPFFTTKEIGKGTGLGLATVYGIVSQSNGYMDVQSKVGQGTTFSIFLPRSSMPLENRSREVTGDELDKGTETVLLVEDEESLRQFALKGLRHLGYNVLFASDGMEALHIALLLETPPDIVLTDVMMPRMGGVDLMKRLREKWPEIKVIFMSGYSETLAEETGIEEGKDGYLQKPFRLQELARKLRENLL